MAALRLHTYPPLVAGRFLGRRKRFLADMELPGGERVLAHCPNTGSMKGLLVPGAPALLSPATGAGRVTGFTWELVRIGRTWVAVNTALTNHLAARALRAGAFRNEFGDISALRAEVGLGNSRIDFRAERGGRATWIEVKSVTLCQGGRAAFPDAVTARGLKHLETLVERIRAGDRAGLVFLVQRSDARFFEPATDIDPAYGEGLTRAIDAGLRVVVAVLAIRPPRILWKEKVPLVLPQGT